MNNIDRIIRICKLIFILATIIAGFICGISIIIYRLHNPHMTETEIFLYSVSKYWWLYIMAFITGIISKN